jgi:hypothetical protein
MKNILFSTLLIFNSIAVNAQFSDIDFVSKYNQIGKSKFFFMTGVTLPPPGGNLTPYQNPYSPFSVVSKTTLC